MRTGDEIEDKCTGEYDVTENRDLDLDETESVEVPQIGLTEVGSGSRGILI